MQLIEQAEKPVSKLKITRIWLLLLGVIIFIFWLVFWGVRIHSRQVLDEQTPDFGQSVSNLLIGGFLLTLGVTAYLIVVFTNALMFDLSKPVWGGVKIRMYIANIFVGVSAGLGMGFILSAFVSPMLVAVGFDNSLANLLPVFGMIGLIQATQLWVLIWAPLEKHFITARLRAQGLGDSQLQAGIMVGLSNPASGLNKRFAAIEEDMGELWVTPDVLQFRGDLEHLDINRDKLTRVERKADTRSATMLAGVKHVVLHLRQPDGNERAIRLHVEGIWTMGGKRPAMDHLANLITTWYANPPQLPVPDRREHT